MSYLHCQSQNFASWVGRGKHWRGPWWCLCCCCSSSTVSDTGQHTALSPPQTAVQETAKTEKSTQNVQINRNCEMVDIWSKPSLTFETSALCVAKQCWRYRALWLQAMLWSSTFRTPPRMLSFDSVTDTVCRNRIQLCITSYIYSTTMHISILRSFFTYLHNNLQSVQDN